MWLIELLSQKRSLCESPLCISWEHCTSVHFILADKLTKRAFSGLKRNHSWSKILKVSLTLTASLPKAKILPFEGESRIVDLLTLFYIHANCRSDRLDWEDEKLDSVWTCFWNKNTHDLQQEEAVWFAMFKTAGKRQCWKDEFEAREKSEPSALVSSYPCDPHYE